MVLPMNFEVHIPKDDPVRLLRHFIGGMDLTELYNTYSRVEKKHNKTITPPRKIGLLFPFADGFANIGDFFTFKSGQNLTLHLFSFMGIKISCYADIGVA